MENKNIRKTSYFILSILLASYFAVSPAVTVSADSKDTEQQLNAAKEQRDQTEEAIDQNQDNIDSLNQTKNSLQGELGSLNSSLEEVSSNLADIEQQISDKNDEIESTQNELDEATARADGQYESMKKRIQFMYERGDNYVLEAILEAGSFGEMLNRANYIEALSAYDRKMLTQYQDTMAEISQKKAELESEETELENLKADAEEEQNRVNGLIQQTAGAIGNYSGQIDSAEAAADALQAQLDAQNSNISALEAQLAEERRLEALSNASVWRDISQVTFAEGDRYLLANLIYCEAGNQPYEGQVGVGAVVINRVLSGAFPDTVVGVIYQSGQFEPVSTGRLALALARDDATDSCYAAADAAMAGQSTVGNCIFFRTPIPEVTPKYTIGGHIFY